MIKAHGKRHSTGVRLVAHGQTFTVRDAAEARQRIKRGGFTRGTMQRVAAYWPVDDRGRERDDLPLVWKNLGPSRRFTVTKRGRVELEPER